MMLFPYISDPDTGSRIPSISTGGAAMKATMNTEVAVKRVGCRIGYKNVKKSVFILLGQRIFFVPMNRELY